MPATPRTQADQFTKMTAEWQRLTTEPDPVPGWAVELDRLHSEQNRLRSDGLWRSGRKTLLGALGLHHDEVIMCRGLAWLLTPDAWHGVGTGLIGLLLDRIGVESLGAERATVVVEEPRDDTRADIVVRFGSTTVLIEAKVWALEQPTQCDRLASHWSDEQPWLVFLTRDGKDPVTAVESRGSWHSLAWSGVAEMLEQAIVGRVDLAAGVNEYLDTLKHYGGSRR